MEKNTSVTPMLFPYQPDQFWEQLQQIVRDEIGKLDKSKGAVSVAVETPGLTYKPLYRWLKFVPSSRLLSQPFTTGSNRES